jgi:hypothetical protein
LVGAVVLTNGDGQETLRVTPATVPDASSPTTVASSTTTVVTVPAASAKTGKATPDEAVVAWLEALGAGKVDEAVGLVGPRTEAYYRALGGNLRGVMVESQEGQGAWADSPDRSTTEVDLGIVDGVGMTVVAVSGTWTGEGSSGFRVDALPVIRSGRGGTWLVEPAAFDPKGGRLELIRPSPGESGLSGLAADASLEAAAPGSGAFWFSLDDDAPTKVPGRPTGGGVRATYDPPGDMRSRSHLLVVAYVDGATFTAFGGVFTVEG